ncbi:hypothetical protein KSF_107670 [Reticulibacter mediterranei]|uniref:Uncharacterized protein n=1 Tax=Reticulibacter mediterranei TaxID=2778369 RepID=A0A8J3N715_9CHLR|nr:hypothetical protein [Reticulibacter mediterranei]GHP00720.1 hypothetical protein KSF_107670 [Reticulibacter mediterranei]
MDTSEQNNRIEHFFDDTVIALRFQGHLYGVFPSHANCVRKEWNGKGISTVFASDEEALNVSVRHCHACHQMILNEDECGALAQVHAEWSLQVAPAYVFRWSKERNHYEAELESKLIVVSWAQMANTVYKCLCAGLNVKMAFDAREWELGPGETLRFIVLKKRNGSTPSL